MTDNHGLLCHGSRSPKRTTAQVSEAPRPQDDTTYRFGFVRSDVSITFDGGSVTPLPDYTQAKVRIDQYTHRDGFIYPPQSWLGDEQGTCRSNTERPAHLFKLPASHSLVLHDHPANADEHRSRESFILHLLGYLYGSIFQFEDWWFDARVPVQSTHNVSFQRQTAEHFVSLAFQAWRTWEASTQQRFTNILFMLNRAPSYEWDWERFVIDYMVLDGCYKMAEDLGLIAQAYLPHRERMQGLCRAFLIQERPELTERIVELRNDLFHETLWDRGQPGSTPSSEPFYIQGCLHRFNQRLIPVLLGYRNRYVRGPWWSIGHSVFDRP